MSLEMELSSPLVTITSGHSGLPVWSCSFNPLSPSVFSSGGRDGCAYLWSAASPSSPQRIFAGHSSDVTSLVFHPNGLYVITASADGSCRLFDASSGDCLRAYSSHATTTTTTSGVNGVRGGGGGGGSVRLGCLAISPSGFSLAAGDDAGRVFLWEISTGMLMTVWTGHGKEGGGGGGGGASLDCIAFSPDGRILASAATATTSSSRRRRISANGGVNDEDEDQNNEMAMMISSSQDDETTLSSSSSSSLLLSSSTLCLWSVEAVVNAIKASSIRGGGSSSGGAAAVGSASTSLNKGKGTLGLLCSYSLKSTTAHALTFEEDEGLVLVGTHNHV